MSNLNPELISMTFPIVRAQTKELQPGQYVLDSRCVRARFLTPYYAQFVTALKEGAEAPASDIQPSA